jgi:hypothetical protein
MNEFDLRKFLYNNPLLESEKKLKAKKKELEKQEDKLDAIDMKDEDAKEKAKHHKDAIKNVKKEIKDLEKDLKFDEKAEKKEKKEEKKKKAIKEAATQSLSESFKFYYREGPRGLKQARQARELLKQKGIELGGENEYLLDFTNSEIGEEEALKLMRDNNLTRFVILREEATAPKLTKEGLKEMIKEKITSILNEEEDAIDDEEIIDDTEEEIPSSSKPTQSAEVKSLLDLLTKAREEARGFNSDPELAELWAEMSLEHSKPSKAAHGRARSAATKIKKLIGEYKKASVAEDKT